MRVLLPEIKTAIEALSFANLLLQVRHLAVPDAAMPYATYRLEEWGSEEGSERTDGLVVSAIDLFVTLVHTDDDLLAEWTDIAFASLPKLLEAVDTVHGVWPEDKTMELDPDRLESGEYVYFTVIRYSMRVERSIEI